jgi:hypothetical protein
MNEFPSSILRIGMVNSGMFDLLELNLDVKAIHLIGQNNVGKTSLISLIQFLYFHDAREMTFPKSLPESLAFYFRREGAYILFEVRTLLGTRRTVGVYGEGIAASREVFVFDGSFALVDFLDENRYVLPLKQVQEKFFERSFHRYQKFEDYEKALLGENADAGYNVQLFDLSTTNFRLLRKLLQGLLRLDKLTSGDVQQFLINIVETGAVKTKINISQDFERKNREILQIQGQLNELRRLEPIIKNWQFITGKIDETNQRLETSLERLYHTSSRYLTILTDQAHDARTHYETLTHQTRELEEKQKTLIEKRTNSQHQLDEWAKTIDTFQSLQQVCEAHSKLHTEQERNDLIAQKVELEQTLATVQPENLQDLRRQRQQRLTEQARLRRQLDQRTLTELWQEARLSDTEQSLLKFLISERLSGLPVETAVDNPEEFIAASRQVLTYLDHEETFRGFGLVIPKSEWYVPAEAMESLAERLERLAQEIDRLNRKIEVAENRARTEAELRHIDAEIRQKDEILRKFEELETHTTRYGSLTRCRERRESLATIHQHILAKTEQLEARLTALRKEAQQLYADLSSLEREIKTANQTHQALKSFATDCPPDIQNMPEADLPEEYRLAQDRVRRRRNELIQLEEQLQEPQTQLDARYDRESPELTFEQWIERKLNITQEIVRFEEQLHENYNNLIILVRGELDKLTQAFEAVQFKVVDLNNLIKTVSISNIDRIEVGIKESELVEAIRQTGQLQMDLFSANLQTFSFEQAREMVDDYLSRIRNYGRELNLKDMFKLEFRVKFIHSQEISTTTEIHKFESHGTETGIKIVLYLGLIRLLQGQKKSLNARLPFFLDEVGSIDSNNLKQLIAYCEETNFLPIFASPEIRQDIPHNYIFQRNGERSILVNEMIITEQELENVYETPTLDI